MQVGPLGKYFVPLQFLPSPEEGGRGLTTALFLVVLPSENRDRHYIFSFLDQPNQTARQQQLGSL